MDEITPGILHWSTPHPRIGAPVSSYLLTDSGTAIDPLLPNGEGPEWLGQDVRNVVVTICGHTRSTQAFGLPVKAPRAGLHRWEGRDIDAQPYDDGDEVAPGVRAIQVGALAPDDFALHVMAGAGALAIGDTVMRYGGQISLVPDQLMGDEPDTVKRATFEGLQALLDLEFDALLFAHGDPIPSNGKAALRAFVDARGA